METKNFTCIIFFKDGQKPKKYTYVNKLTTFYKFVNNLQSAWYINIYDRKAGTFIKRHYL